MLMPKRVKHRKQFRGSMAGKATRGNKITYGEYGIVSLEPCWIKANQIEAARVAMTRYIKRGGKVWIKIFPEKPVTHKPMGVRMGKGKGALEFHLLFIGFRLFYNLIIMPCFTMIFPYTIAYIHYYFSQNKNVSPWDTSLT